MIDRETFFAMEWADQWTVISKACRKDKEVDMWIDELMCKYEEELKISRYRIEKEFLGSLDEKMERGRFWKMSEFYWLIREDEDRRQKRREGSK